MYTPRNARLQALIIFQYLKIKKKLKSTCMARVYEYIYSQEEAAWALKEYAPVPRSQLQHYFVLY